MKIFKLRAPRILQSAIQIYVESSTNPTICDSNLVCEFRAPIRKPKTKITS